jgi:hypothetical protein
VKLFASTPLSLRHEYVLTESGKEFRTALLILHADDARAAVATFRALGGGWPRSTVVLEANKKEISCVN